MNHKQDKAKETYAKTSENQRQNLESNQREITPQLYRKNYSKDNIFLIRNHGDLKKWHNILQVLKEKKRVNPESYTQQKYP